MIATSGITGVTVHAVGAAVVLTGFVRCIDGLLSFLTYGSPTPTVL